MSPVMSRLGQNIIASPLPLTWTRTVPSAVSINRDSATVQCRLLQVETAQHFAQHLVVDLTAVAFGDERGTFGREHLQSQAPERRRRALADLFGVAAQAFPCRVASSSVPAAQHICGSLMYIGDFPGGQQFVEPVCRGACSLVLCGRCGD